MRGGLGLTRTHSAGRTRSGDLLQEYENLGRELVFESKRYEELRRLLTQGESQLRREDGSMARASFTSASGMAEGLIDDLETLVDLLRDLADVKQQLQVAKNAVAAEDLELFAEASKQLGVAAGLIRSGQLTEARASLTEHTSTVRDAVADADSRRRQREEAAAREEARKKAAREEAAARERARKEAEERKRLEAAALEKARMEAEEQARLEAAARERHQREAEEKARREAEARDKARMQAEYVQALGRAEGGRLAQLLRRADWRASNPARNAQGKFEMVHVPTGLVFVLVPGGQFRMGSTSGEPLELPVHVVKVAAFLLAKTECTQSAWDKIGGEDSRKWRGGDLPIEGVTWHSVKSWCRRAGLRLPSEAEWEYACRAGSTTKWSFGDNPDPLGRYAQYAENSGHVTKPVGAKLANNWGLHDMIGNAFEWCEDTLHALYLDAPTDGTAWVEGGVGLDDGVPFRILRGGCLMDPATDCRSAVRRANRPTYGGPSVGFRPALSLP